MATRPSPRSDAQIRDQYRRGLRRSPQAQAIAEDLERTNSGYSTRALSRWNSGEDPALGAMSEANAAVAARGFSAASADRGRAMDAVSKALQAQPDSNLPPQAKEMFGRMRDRLPGNAEEFLSDADEYAGRRAGSYSLSAPKGRDKKSEEAEKAVQRQGLAAEDYWERNPDAKRTARNSKGDEIDVMELSRKYQDDRAQENQREGNFQQALANNRANSRFNGAERLAEQLSAKGLDQMPVKEGRPDMDKMRGLLSAATFQAWDDDKTLDRAAGDLERSTKRELRYWEDAQDGSFGVGAQIQAMAAQDRIAQLRADLNVGNKRGSLSGPDGWRELAERELSNNAKRAAATDNLVKAANTKTMSYQDLASSFGTTIEKIEEYLKDGVLSPEELQQVFGSPAS
jgi:hypothetical protein